MGSIFYKRKLRKKLSLGSASDNTFECFVHTLPSHGNRSGLVINRNKTVYTGNKDGWPDRDGTRQTPTVRIHPEGCSPGHSPGVGQSGRSHSCLSSLSEGSTPRHRINRWPRRNPWGGVIPSTYFSADRPDSPVEKIKDNFQCLQIFITTVTSILIFGFTHNIYYIVTSINISQGKIQEWSSLPW